MIYDSVGHTREVRTVEGTLEIDSGDFTVTLSDSSNADAPKRGKLTVGFTGEDINK